jgi:Tat protein secretion system quality control protein TatD with DNase activity
MEELIDIGVNLTHASFKDDRAQVIERARQAGVSTLVLTGTSLAGSRRALELARTDASLWATCGVHPRVTPIRRRRCVRSASWPAIHAALRSENVVSTLTATFRRGRSRSACSKRSSS